MDAITTLDSVKLLFQPPDAENRMSGGVGGMTGAIPSSRPDYWVTHFGVSDFSGPGPGSESRIRFETDSEAGIP